MSFTTYIESWGITKPFDLVQQMINNNILSNTRIVLSFASFNFNGQNYIPGIQNMTITDIQNLTNLVHTHGSRISLSIGGATYSFTDSDLYSRPGDLASNINQILLLCGFDGVDFDVEDNYLYVPSNFVNQMASVINTLRSLNNGLYITLTTPGQAWSSDMYQQSLLNMTIGNINAWQPMEYDLWIEPSSNYPAQIQWDIKYYLTEWKVEPSKIILGIMPGNDDMGHNLSLQNSLELVTFCQIQNLQGIMMWDANIDSTGINGNAPYTYIIEIQSHLSKKHIKDSL
jgi:hypothetical protein